MASSGPLQACSAMRSCAGALVALVSLGISHPSLSMERIQLDPNGFGRPSDQMGRSVALLGDTAAVGAPRSAPNGFQSGAIDIYRLVGGTWQTETVLTPPDAIPNGNFGWSVALGPDLLVASFSSIYTFERQGSTWNEVDEIPSVIPVDQIGLSGDTLVVGDTIYTRSGSGWQIQTTLQADNDGEFFTDAAIDGDLLVVATTGTGLETPHTVYFYSRTGDTWTREGSVALANALATVHIAMSGNTALVGSVVDSNTNVASVRVFDRDDTGNWADHGTLEAGVDFVYDAPVAIDGDRAIVGSDFDYTAYTFARSGGAWTLQSHFNDPNAHCFAAVALSGSTALAGCPGSFTPATGYGIAAFFSLDANPPLLLAEFGQGNAHAGEEFGWTVAAGDDTFVAGALSGLYFYQRGTSGWTQTNAFPPPLAGTLAMSAAIDGDTAAIGYPAEVFPGGTNEIEVYARNGNAWALQSTVPGPPVTDGSPSFAYALALEGDVLVANKIGQPSSTCGVFHRTGGVWQAEPDLTPIGGASYDYFCWSLSMSGDTLIVGAPTTNIGAQSHAGAAYVFVRTDSGWTQQTQLLAPLVATGAGFGTSVAIRGNTAVVGSNNDLAPQDSTRGAVDVYRRTGSTWTWQATLLPQGSGNAPGDYGFAVALSDAEDRIVATAPYDLTHDPYAGVAFAFAFDGTAWSQTYTLHASPPFAPTTNDLFGYDEAFSGDEIVIGASADGNGGAVYVAPTSERIFANGFE